MGTRNTSGEVLTNTDRAILAGCYQCHCEPCTLKREVIEKLIRIADGVPHVRQPTTDGTAKEDGSLIK